MGRVSQETLDRLDAFLDSLPAEARNKCVLCTETLTHIVKQAEVQTGAGTATVTNYLADRINEDAAPQDQVSGGALRERVRWNEGLYSESLKIDTIATKWTGDQESYTPAKYIESARLVMGSIDVDPASNKFANEVVKADIFYTKEDNGLDKEWHGNVFLNPPYSHPEIKHFVDKLIHEYQEGRTKQAILLTNNNTDTNFFHDAIKVSGLVCFTKGRINFYKNDGSITQPTNGQAFYAFGLSYDVFVREFSKYGTILRYGNIIS